MHRQILKIKSSILFIHAHVSTRQHTPGYVSIRGRDAVTEGVRDGGRDGWMEGAK